jgi:5'(3')-deoxyribonucleotidase
MKSVQQVANRYNTGARRFLIDLDGVAADFATARDESGLTSDVFKLLPGSYLNLKPYPEAIVGIRQLIARGFDCWIATKIPHDNPYAAAEKLFWVKQHLPELFKSVIITPNKGTLGTQRDFLIDDRPHKAHIDEFAGTLLTYGHKNEFQNWEQVMEFMSKRLPDANIQFDEVVDGVVIPVRANSRKDLFIRKSDLPEALLAELLAVHNASFSFAYTTRVDVDSLPYEVLREYACLDAE